MWYWQNLQPAGENQIFYAFCDALEVKDGVSAPAEGWGLEHALAAYGTYMSEFLNLICKRYIMNRYLICLTTMYSVW